MQYPRPVTLRRALLAAAGLAIAAAMAPAMLSLATIAAAPVEAPSGPDIGPRYALVLLVNHPDGSQSQTTIADGLEDGACVPMMRAIWWANGAAPIIGYDEAGAIPAFDAACMPS